MASTKGTVSFNVHLKMLVIFILIFYLSDFCYCKAFREESEKIKGKRLYNHESDDGLPTYNPEGNAEHWMSGNFYQPQVDGQPIYVPALDLPGSYNEFLDAYYKSYTPAWNLETPVPHTYHTKSTYKNPEKFIVVTEANEAQDYFLPTLQKNEAEINSNDYASESEDYEFPEVIDKTVVTKLSNKNIIPVTEMENLDEFDEPILYGSLKKPESSTKKSEDYIKYEQPIVKTVEQKQNTNIAYEDTYERPISVSMKTEKKKIDYEKKVERESLTKKSEPSKAKPEDYDEYEEPVIVKRVKQKVTTNKVKDVYKPYSSEMPQMDNLEYEEPVEHESLTKTSEPPKAKPEEYGQYEKPVIVKRVKQKTTNKMQENVYKPYSSETTQMENLQYEEPIEHESLTKKTAPSKAKPEEYDQYEKPVIVKRVKQKTTNKVQEDVYKPYSSETPQMENLEYEQIEHESLTKKTEPPKAKPGEYDQYEKPVIVKRIKQKTTNKVQQDVYKPSVSETSSIENAKVYEPVQKTTKKRITKPPSKYNGGNSATGKKPKGGKRKKQSSKPYNPTAGITRLVNEDALNPEMVTSASDELSKIEGQNPSHDKQTEGNLILLTHPEKTSEIKENGVTEIKRYDFVQTNGKDVLRQSSKDNSETQEVTEKSESDLILSNTDSSLEDFDYTDNVEMVESELSKNKINFPKPIEAANYENSGNSKIDAIEKWDSISPQNDFRGLPSVNSNIWSLLFNPNAEQNRLQKKRCVTRSNENGFCTYIQNCDVPQIATSLEQLLSNACVIDEIFIGVCCPEFPVETVKVHWDSTVSDFDNQIEDEFGHNAEDCGVRSNEASKLQSWPWKAPLVSMSNGKIFCGGVLVSQDHVLTAAHCTTKIPKNQILVRLGQFDESSGDDYAVVEIKRHAQYNSRTMNNDVALLKLGRRIMNGVHIGTICLPEDDKNEHDGETATLLGWRGIFGTKSRDPEFLEVISNEQCKDQLGMKVSNAMLCTETRKESGRTCNADSGAPLVIKHDGKYEVIGILAWNRNDCDQRFPSTFSRVSSYTDWIKNHLS